jgi:hypothetical protein
MSAGQLQDAPFGDGMRQQSTEPLAGGHTGQVGGEQICHGMVSLGATMARNQLPPSCIDSRSGRRTIALA